MKILHVIPSFYPAYVYGGPTESSYQLCRHLALQQSVVRVLTTDANGPDKVLDVETNQEVKLAEGLCVRYCKRLFRHSVSLTFLHSLPSYVRWADVVHLTAVYSFPTIPTFLACRVIGKPLVWSSRGALQRWSGSTRVIPKAIWEQVCRVVAPKRLILHATSEEEAAANLKRFPHAETVVIPNGINIPEKVTHVQGTGTLRLLYLGRLHSIKGIENLLTACKMLDDGSGGAWSLIIAGVGDPHYTETILARIDQLGLRKPVTMAGEVEGATKQRVFENSDLVVVPSYTENFGMVVAEALAHGVPVIASKGTPWKRLEDVGCGLCVENDPQSLATAIKRISGMPLKEMGQRGREWMMREFDWDRRAQEMAKCYEHAAAVK